jgi:hypothetical protein
MAVGTTRRVVDWWGDGEGEGEGEGEGLVSGLAQIANRGRSGAIMQSMPKIVITVRAELGRQPGVDRRK